MSSISSKGKVGVVGSGLVGKSWAMIFASVGYKVTLFDVEASQLTKALSDIRADIDRFDRDGVLRGNVDKETQKALVSTSTNLEDVVKGSMYIQECVPEKLELKISVWTKIIAHVDVDEAVLASSTSCIVPSLISEKLDRREQFIVAHPVNPPYLAPMTELVPAPWTSEGTRTRARAIMNEVGQVPVSLTKELPGFVLNRIQYAILNECWRLVASGAVSPDDLDVVMRDGLGLRYAFMGPMETIHLNAEGTQNYFDRYGETITNVSKTFGEIPKEWVQTDQAGKDEIARIAAMMRDLYPLDKLDERRNRRDNCLAALAKLKKTLPK